MNGPFAEVFRYNKWANLTLLNACSTLTERQLDTLVPGVTPSGFPIPTVRGLLLHIVGGQQTFVLRTKGRQNEGELNRDSAWPGFDALISIATSTSDELIAIAEPLDTDEDVVLPYAGKRFAFPKSFFLVHALEHGDQHRAEVKLALGAVGIETPDLDGWSYAQAMGYGCEV
jgi:uncharacterized damage-inducible protein DinB